MKITLNPDEVKKDFSGRFCKYLYSLERIMLQVHVDKGQRIFWVCTIEGGHPHPMKGGLLRLDVSLLDEHGESIELRNKDGYNA